MKGFLKKKNSTTLDFVKFHTIIDENREKINILIDSSQAHQNPANTKLGCTQSSSPDQIETFDLKVLKPKIYRTRDSLIIPLSPPLSPTPPQGVGNICKGGSRSLMRMGGNGMRLSVDFFKTLLNMVG